ncbi:hypothetical protein BpHYR1_018923 [Brachionus plicatilis]|uniref:Uncharacterized protein n=1 Tax=Brachionus plicatilis TaxID=10195 RepID=A0A3M7S6U2_BRAPC|nr:hypothetical protein BpHYR1_018923 [Brachionus plicatilis]
MIAELFGDNDIKVNLQQESPNNSSNFPVACLKRLSIKPNIACVNMEYSPMITSAYIVPAVPLMIKFSCFCLFE